MAKITYITIVGKDYPMSFSLGAAKKIMEKYGGTGKLMKKMDESESDTEKLEMISDILALLIAQGCAYKNYFEADIPAPDNAPVVDGKWTPIPKDIIDIALGVYDSEAMVKSINECISAGSKKDLSTKPTSKNAKTTRE